MNLRTNVVIGRIIRYIYAISTVLLLFLTALLILQIFIRSAGLEIDGLGELAQFAAIWMALLIIGNLEYDERHIRVDFFVDKLPERYQQYVDGLVLLINTVTVGFFFISALVAVSTFWGGQSPALGIPAPMYHAAPLVGFLILFALYGTDLVTKLHEVVASN